MGKYTFFWLCGVRDVYEGKSPADALNKAGVGQGAVRALDFWAEGDNKEYGYDKDKKEWVKK